MHEILALRLGARSTPAPMLMFQTYEERAMCADFFSWCVVGSAGPVLIDPGFSRSLATQKNVDEIISSADALGAVGIDPLTVETIIITHLHWDHFGSSELFPNARFYVQDLEVRHLENSLSRRHAYSQTLPDREEVDRVFAEGRMECVSGDQEIVPGVRTVLVGGHTFGSQLVIVEAESGSAVICGDAANLYRNVEDDIPPGVLADMDRALLALDRIKELAASPRHVLPSHDPLVLERLDRVQPGVGSLR